MELAAQSRARVQERLARLEEAFGSPTVNQTTFAVGEAAYQRAVEQAQGGRVDVHAIVRNETGDVLLREADGGWAIPRGQTRRDEALDAAARRVVREHADIDCSIADAVRATISGIRNGDDPDDEAVYRLSVVFTAEPTDETERVADDELRWDADPDAIDREFV